MKLKIGDRIRIVSIPNLNCLPPETERVWRKLIKRGRSVRISEIDEYGIAWYMGHFPPIFDYTTDLLLITCIWFLFFGILIFIRGIIKEKICMRDGLVMLFISFCFGLIVCFRISKKV